MTEIACRRVTAGSGASSALGQGEQTDPDQRRQGKSAAFGRAHVDGLFEHFGHLKNWPCWRFAKNVQRFQRTERHRLPSDTRLPT